MDLSTGIAQDGFGGTDTLVNIERARGSENGDDTLIGDAGDNELDGRAGDDTLIGVIDSLRGGDGDDTLQGGVGQSGSGVMRATIRCLAVLPTTS